MLLRLSYDLVNREDRAARLGSLDVSEAHFHRPGELLEAMGAAGLLRPRVQAVEGPLGQDVDLMPDTSELFDRARALAHLLEADPDATGTSPHLLGIGIVP